MNRLWVRFLVFVGLLVAAGIAWGVLECAMFTKNIFNYTYLDGTKSNAAFAYPVAVLLSLAAVWLAALCVFRDTWKAGESLIELVMILGINMIGFTVAPSLAVMDRFYVPLYTMGGVMLSAVAFFIAIAIHHRASLRSRPKPPKPDWRHGAPLFILFLTAMLGLFFWVTHGEADKFYRMCAFGGMSLPTAFQFANLTNLAFGRWFVDALLSGAIAGVWVGFFFSTANDQNASARHQLRVLIISAAMGMVVSGMMYGAKAVLLLKSYAVAWNGAMLLPTALAIWGGVGALFGLALTFTVHILLVSEPTIRYHKLKISLSVLMPVILVGAVSAWAFVRQSSRGMYLLQQAARLEGKTTDIAFGLCDSDESRSERPRQRQIIVMGESKFYTNKLQSTSVDTIAACKQLLSRYPQSAFTSAALYTLAQAYHSDWQPANAAEVFGELQCRFPYQRYDTSGLSSSFRLSDLMLAGDYQGTLDAAKRDKGSRFADTRNAIRAYAAEVLGDWDEAVKARQSILSSYAKTKNPTKKWMDKLKARLQRAQSMQARGAGPMPKTNVTGRLLYDNIPLAKSTICLIPSDRISPDDHRISPS